MAEIAPAQGLSGSLRAASVAAALLLIASGATYRAVERAHNRVDHSDPLPPHTLDKLPMHIGDWDGSDVPLDAEIIELTRTDQHVNRLYRDRGNRPPQFIFVAYGVNMRDLLPHRPEVCYPGAGWTLKGTHTMDLPHAWNGGTLTVQVHRFDRGLIGAERITVVNYYIVDGVTCPDVTLLRDKASSLRGQARYAAQVEITSSGGNLRDVSQAVEAAQQFAAESADAIRRLLPTDHAAASAATQQAAPHGAAP